MAIRVLIVEDERLIRWSLRQKFEQQGYEVTEADCGAAAMSSLESDGFDLVMLDHKLPDMTGLDVLRQLRQRDLDVVVIIMTAYSKIENAVEAIKLGAFDYLAKPFEMEMLLVTVRKALETTKLRRQVRELREHLRHDFGFDQVVATAPGMVQLMDVVRQVSRSDATTVFLRGETGTGKDLLAGVIHYNSDRAPKPFMNITCTAISETLLESELFGHERGAFTDAKLQKKGLFELADGGTVFLDEVGDMTTALQAKLLRFLEDRTFRRVGGADEISVDVRIIAATNRNIEEAVEGGQFRRDLMFRLNVVPVFLPPLRDRGDDIRLLADRFITKFASDFKKPIESIEPVVYERLLTYAWPGNVRELRNVCERAVLLSSGEQLRSDDIVLGNQNQSNDNSGIEGLELPDDGLDFQELEVQLLCQALARTAGNQTKAAKLLNLSRDTFRYRLEKHGLL